MPRYPTPAAMLAVTILLAGCAGGPGRSDAMLRPAEIPECLVDNPVDDLPDTVRSTSAHYQRCHPHQRLEWSSDGAGKNSIKPGFSGHGDS
ncbi:MAG: hypothetical protein QM601_11920 [Pseudoxanthomonas sp.]